MKRLVCRTLFAALAVTVFALALAFSGCAEKNPVKPDPPDCDTCGIVNPPDCDTCGPPDSTIEVERTLDPSLITEEGYAWQALVRGAESWAFIFKGDADSTVRWYRSNDYGIFSPVYTDGKWYTLGTDLYITLEGDVAKIPYSVAGNSVTMVLPMLGPEPVPVVFSKEAWTVGGGGGDDDGERELDPALILPEGWAWVGTVDEVEISQVYHFNADGTVEIRIAGADEWADEYVGGWYTEGDILYITYDDGHVEDIRYSVSGETMTMAFPGDDDEVVLQKLAWPFVPSVDDGGAQ